MPKAAIGPTGKSAHEGAATEDQNSPPKAGETAEVPAASDTPRAGRRSACEGFREIIETKFGQGLSAQRIFQDLTSDHAARLGYDSVKRFARRLREKTPLPFRRLECAAGEEAQVDFGTGAPLVGADGKRRRTHVFRVVLSHSRAPTQLLDRQADKQAGANTQRPAARSGRAQNEPRGVLGTGSARTAGARRSADRQDELLVRDDRQIARRVKAADFRELKPLDDFDWSFNPSINRKQVYDLATCHFIRARRDVLLLGPPGVGKSFLVQTLGHEAIKQGFLVGSSEEFVGEFQPAIGVTVRFLRHLPGK